MKSIKLFFGLVAALFMTVTSQMGAQIPYTVSSAPSTTNNGGRWAADTKWYFIQFPNSDDYHTNGYLATEGNNYINSNGQLLLNGTEKPQSSAGLWCIVENETGGYSFYNRKTGVGKVLSMTPNGVAKVLAVGTAGQVQAFDYAASTSTNYAGKATFKFHGSDYYWSNSDLDPKCHLGVWDNRALSDNGSAVDVIEPTYDDLVNMGLKIKVSTESEKFYYLIKNKRSGKYASFNGTAGLSQVAFDNLTRSSIWYVMADGNGGGYKMYNLGTNKLVNGKDMDDAGCTMYIEENILCPGYFCVSKSPVYDANCWDDQTSSTTIGYYAPKPGNYEGTSWAFEEAYQSVAKTKLALLLTEYRGNKYGVNPGQYKPEGHTWDEFTQALANAQAVLDSGSEDEANSMLSTFENFTFVKNVMEVGAYYRLQNTARQTWASIEIKDTKVGTSRMRCKAYEESNPLQIWKLEQDGDNYFLVNVASGLYPQEVISGGNNTTDMGEKNAAYKFTWNIFSEASESAMPVHRIYFGGNQVNVEENGNMNYWYAENARFYIWKVEKTDEELLGLVNDWAQDHYTASNAATKIDVTPGVTQVISPNEFAAPEVVNAAVDAMHAYTGAANPTLEQAQALYNSHSIVNTYWNAATTSGGLLSVPYTLKAKYGTLILPINYSRPNNVKLYSCAADVDGVLTLVEFTDDDTKNKPFIVEYTDETKLPTTEAAYTYQFIGYQNGAATTNQTEGWLTGVLEDDQYVPAGGYILAKKDGALGFYQVGADNVKAAAKYKCYLQPTSQTSAQLAYFFNRDDATTAITNLLNGGENGKVEIYDLSGKRLNNLQKGVNIVNGKKIIVR